MTNIALLASGNGSNAQRIIEYFSGNAAVNIALIISNNQTAYVRQRAANLGVKEVYISRTDFKNGEKVVDILTQNKIDFIVLAGFMQLIPSIIINKYQHKIINIHPALLPAYGGKGMYGMHVHEAVIANKETASGITIHYVNEVYDDGEIIFQASCQLNDEDTPETLAQKIHELEHAHFPRVIEQLISK